MLSIVIDSEKINSQIRITLKKLFSDLQIISLKNNTENAYTIFLELCFFDEDMKITDKYSTSEFLISGYDEVKNLKEFVEVSSKLNIRSNKNLSSFLTAKQRLGPDLGILFIPAEKKPDLVQPS